MHILGFQKTTLLDYPGKLAATIFLGGCNFRCPFCHNREIVVHPNQSNELDRSEILHTLSKRSNILDAVCITGGEPTLFPDLPELIKEIRELGLLVKLDTNGSNPDMLQSLIDQKLLDYVAMDLKNSPSKYPLTIGHSLDLDKIYTSVDLLKQNMVDYEFRTTVVKELHNAQDFVEIGQWISGAKRYYLQNFVNSDRLICPNVFSSYPKESLLQFLTLLRPYVTEVDLRGID